ncbi:MAG: alpha/beta fold hydrolase, partial [Pseudohongiellaceae bacterium]
QIRDIDIRIHRDGQGSPALFLHGANGVAGWTPMFKALAGEVDLRVPEHPWFGHSQKSDRIATVADLALFYLDVLDTLDLKGVHLIGTSLGGWVASEIAIRNSSRLASLTLVAPAGLPAEGTAPSRFFHWEKEEAVRNLFYDQDIAERMLAQPLSPEQAQVDLKNRIATCRFAMPTNFRSRDLEHWLHRIHLPTTLIWGSDDRVFPVESMDRWTNLLPNATTTVIEQCGHLPHVEKPDEVLSAFVSFIQDANR